MYIIGLMSGTSGDGIDAALVRIEGERETDLTVEMVDALALPFDDPTREAIFELFRPSTGSVDKICRMNFVLGELFAQAAEAVAREAGFALEQIDLIASHGQTIWHNVAGAVKSTLQIGEPAVIAERTGVTTIANFRVRDVAAGGQGAPLVPYADYLLFRDPHITRALQNIGGIANVTILPAGCTKEQVYAFDTGPGNMLIDAVAERASDGRQRYDLDGRLAAAGTVNEKLLAELMAHPYLQLPPPKTTGREEFGRQFAAELFNRAGHLSCEDLAATVTAYTAQTIAEAYRRWGRPSPQEVIVGGGGARNPVLMQMLAEALAPAKVMLADEFGISADYKEAIAFAMLGYATWQGWTNNMPGCTGARHSVIMGQVTPGRNLELRKK